MKDLYGAFIIFFYFIKYPMVILLPIGYFYLDFKQNEIMNVLWIISLILIFKDMFRPKETSCCGDNCKRD